MVKRNRYRNPLKTPGLFRVLFICLALGGIGACFVTIRNRHVTKGNEITQREREITQLLLRGHSSKSIARELGIAPGTVMVHKRNLFAKLGITSQYELFSSFIDALSDS